jgi:hypothetical protein
MKRPLLILAVLPFALLSGCISVKTHSTIEPIHMTLDVNLKVQLEKELANVFADIDAASKTINVPTASSK